MRNYLTSFLLLFFAFSSLQAQSEEYGVASYYNDAFQGRKTASGQAYDKKKLTAAHKSLPFGTLIEVSRIDNGKKVQVRINDRGPYMKGRIVDLSRAAAQRLDLITDGKAKVKIRVVGSSNSAPTTTSTKPSTGSTSATTPVPDLSGLKVGKKTPAASEEKRPTEFSSKSVQPVGEPRIVAEARKTTPAPKPAAKPKPVPAPVAPTTASTTSSTVAKRVKSKDYKVYDLYKIQLLRPERKGFGVQVASLSQYEYVMKQVAELQENWFNNILVSVEQGKKGEPIYKVILGPFADRKTANSYKKELKKKKKIEGFVVDLK